MLPIGSTGVKTWESVGRGGTCALPLPKYLTEFLRRIGAEPRAIHSTLHGWHLPPYQAVVRSDEWRQLWTSLEAPFREMRSAYRHHIGGSAAPELTTSCPPRLMSVAQPDDDADAVSESVPEVEQQRTRTTSTVSVGVRSTFVHCDLPRSSQLRSVRSVPYLALSTDLSRTETQSESGVRQRWTSGREISF